MKKTVCIMAALLLLLSVFIPASAQSLDGATDGKGLVGVEVDEYPEDFSTYIFVTLTGADTSSIMLTSSNYYMSAAYIPAGTYSVSVALNTNEGNIYSVAVSPTTLTVVSGQEYMITVTLDVDWEAKAQFEAIYAESTEAVTEAATEDPVETIVNHTITAAEIVIAICITLFFVGTLAGLIWLARKYIKID